MNYWLVKQEPESYAWANFVKDAGTAWTGVRNYQARNHLRTMAVNDLVFYYHSGDEREVVGLAKIIRAGYADPTASEGDWVCVDLVPVKSLVKPVSLSAIKAEPALATVGLVRQSRLSVMPLLPTEFKMMLKLSQTRM